MYKNEIKKYRKEKGLTLKKLAEISGVSSGYLCHLENGSRDNPSTDVMEKIAISLNKSIPEIFFSN